MKNEIINCYELDFKQDVPAEMEMIKASNESLKKSNHYFKIVLLSIGFGIMLSAFYQISKTRIEEKDKY